MKPGETFVAAAPGSRVVVLKVLDQDCLLRTATGVKLHPSIRDRLARVRELAHARVANLHGVERDGAWVYLVWEYVAGRTLEEWSTDPATTPRDLLLVARELILTLESLHARGIVHGSIHARNVILDDTGRLRLTHVSPLLYSEPEQDTAALAELFRDLAERRGETDSTMAHVAEETADGTAPLRSTGARVASLLDQRPDDATEEVEVRADTRRRGKSRLGALSVLIAAIVSSFGLKYYVNQTSAKPPAPPEAPATALQP